MPSWYLLAFQTATLTFMLIGLFGLIIPIFPGLTVMWLAAVIYAIGIAAGSQITSLGWTVLVLLTILVIVGNIVDNIIITKKVRDKGTSWLSIGIGFMAGLVVSLFFTPLAGLVAAPLGLFLAELYRLRDRGLAFESTKAWMIGFGWAFVTRFIIGTVMIVLWLVWVWS
jgi:uncharacterized protein YqgC (DUF456 family)